MRTIIFDTEGNGCANEQICQLSYIIATDECSYISKNFYFSVDGMNPHAQDVHGLSKAGLVELSSGMRFCDRASEVYVDFSGAELLVGHNVSSDVKRINLELQRHKLAPVKTRTLCTMRHFNKAVMAKDKNGNPKQPSLLDLCSHYGVKYRDIQKSVENYFGVNDVLQHDARFDTVATFLCLKKALKAGDIQGVF